MTAKKKLPGPLGAKLAQLREQKGWSLREAEEQVGISHNHLHRLETGLTTNVGGETLRKLAAAYAVEVAWLLS